MEFAPHRGPLNAGDVIVIEINGHLLPNRHRLPRPQCFLVTRDQDGTESVPLTPVDDAESLKKATRYATTWRW